MSRLKLTKYDGETIELAMSNAAHTRVFQALLDLAEIPNDSTSMHRDSFGSGFKVERILEPEQAESEVKR